MIHLTARRNMWIRLAVRTAALIVAAGGGRLHFNDPQNSGLLGAL